jgi:Phage derived protein Gp49-like (DUF891)
MANQSEIPERYVVAEGSRGSIACAVRSNGRMEAKDFLESPDCRKFKPALLALFQVIVNADPDDDEVRPKPLKKTPIREFVKGQVRVFCFRHGTTWVLTHGVLKKSDHTPPANIERAERIRVEDLEIAAKRDAKRRGHATHDG